ncbi:hypothetical protein [Acinetobacter sp. ACNIH2]|uniref:hypothetical protein n=1 Tax=Acinetobacter sp. ACNIH2 TaxID=1758189 RepID=UPI0026BE5203
MNADAIKKLKKRFDTVWQNRVNDYDDHCAEIALHVLPVRLSQSRIRKSMIVQHGARL